MATLHEISIFVPESPILIIKGQNSNTLCDLSNTVRHTMDIYCVYYNTAEWLRSLVGTHAEAALGGAINGLSPWGLTWRKFSPKII